MAIRSPFFYVGDKYKLMPQLQELFPENIATYYEPFCGGGSSFLNTEAKTYKLNDINTYVIELHKMLIEYINNTADFKREVEKIIEDYGLSFSYKGYTVDDELKKKYKKTYYAHFNKNAYSKLKDDYNEDRDIVKLYVLLIYGFNHMIRFNSNGKFNLPVGNVDYNKNVETALVNYFDFAKHHKMKFYNQDFKKFVTSQKYKKNDFIYFDPPYLISMAEYNALWNPDRELELLKLLDCLNEKGVAWGITNLIQHKGKTNEIFLNWSKQYYTYSINSNYISYIDNTIKESSSEVYVTNREGK